MTKDREHEAKSHHGKAKEKSKHEQAREAHVEEKVESEPAELSKNLWDVSQRRTLSVQPDAEIQEQIRIRAFEIFEQRGRTDGHDLDDWLQAEAELTAERWRVLAA